MAFLYGDGSRSPLELDYLGYLRRMIAVAVEVLLAEDQLLVAGRRAQAQEKRVALLERRLEALHQTVRAAVGGDAGSPDDDAVSRCANQIEGAVEGVVTRAVADLRAQGVAAIADVAAQQRRAHAACSRALETFLREHDLPDAARVIELDVRREGTSLRVHATTPYGVAYEIDLERRGTPLDDSDLRAGALLKTRLAVMKLDRMFVVGARCDARAITVELRNGREAGADGVDIAYDRAADRARMERTGGGTVELAAGDERAVAALAGAFGTALEACAARRVRLSAVTVHDTLLDEHERPSTLIDRVFAAMAPHVRAIVERSPLPGELSLRREVGDGLREEIFVKHTVLAEMVAQVPSARRRHFGVLGLPGLPGVETGPSEDVEIIVDADVESEPSISIQVEG